MTNGQPHGAKYYAYIVRTVRRHLGMKQTELSRLLGHAECYVCNIERGYTKMGLRGYKEMKRILSIRAGAKHAPRIRIIKPGKFTAHDVKELRRRLNFSGREFALLLGVHENSVYNWESGHTRITRVTALKLTALMLKLSGREK